jgi:tetratricopeptide (TPR) repeat protein
MKEQNGRPSATAVIKTMEEQVIAGSKANAIHNCWYSRGFGHSAQPLVLPAILRRSFSPNTMLFGHRSLALSLVLVIAAAFALFTSPLVSAAATAPPPLPPVSDAGSYAAGANSAKAHELVAAAINMTDSERALKLLWQATAVAPALDEPYMYLALYYDSRSQFDKVVEVYQKLLKYQPTEATAYINIGEAYMSFSPPRFDSALPYYLKALQLEPGNAFAALRIGEVYAQKGDPYRGQALRYLNLARSDRTKNPTAAAEADKVLHEMGAS